MPHEEFVLQTEVPAFSCGPDNVILSWNRAAERTFAIRAREVVGRECQEVLCGHDVFGNQFCSRLCLCRQMALQGQPIRPFHLRVQDHLGHRFTVRTTVLVMSGNAAGPELVHLLEPLAGLGPAAEAAQVNGDLAKLSKVGPEFLTRREREVIRCLALGLGTGEIARRLEISVATVRNHVSSCLHKLGAHSRLEALAIARRLGLI